MFTNIFLLSILTVIESKSKETLHYYLFNEECYQKYFFNRDFFNFVCFKLILSKMLGYGIVLGALIVKVPQILKILSKRSVYGLSFASISFELLTNMLTAANSIYRGNPFSTYGETIFILLQMLVIACLFLYFNKSEKQGIMYACLIGLVIAAIISLMPQLLPEVIIKNTMIFQIVLFAVSRWMQIAELIRCKSTGSLALATCLLTFLGNIGRIFTSFIETSDDVASKVSHVFATLLNGFILFLFWYYRNNKKTE